ncbi:MAG TPA: hypothetical protein P5120_19125 [Spirochaetota bacterium]|nr:hypothetical protein [Spirochaetota bacterium]
MGRKIIFTFMLFMITGCAEFDLHIRSERVPAKVSKILIGNFEFRNMTYDPYISTEYREAIKFEFFKRGIDALLIPDSENSLTDYIEKIPELAGKYKGDIFIRGIISQRETGFLTDREINSSVNLIIYSADGRQIGESYYYTDKQAADESAKRDLSERFVNTIIKNLVIN